MKQDTLFRFSETGWQVWNIWAVRLFKSCVYADFHPLGIITDEEWKVEQARINSIESIDVRLAQQANLEEIKQLKDAELQLYHQQPHEFSRALPQATRTLKAYGVS